MAKWLPMLLPALLAAVAALSDVVQPYVVANPTVALLLGAVAAVLGILLKSPLAPKP